MDAVRAIHRCHRSAADAARRLSRNITTAPGWNIWHDGCPHGESTDNVGRRADAFLDAHVVRCAGPVVVVTHGHRSRILAARALGLDAENGRLFASITAAISVIEDHHGERCIGRWNVDAALIDGIGNRTAPSENAAPVELAELTQ